MRIARYVVAAVLLLGAAFVVFRGIVRRDTRRQGRLTPLSGFLELW